MSRPHIVSVLASRPTRVVRPRDLRDVYVNPAAELARLEERGLVRHLAHGYYAAVPPEWIGNPAWRPSIESMALAVAVADYGAAGVALMGPSAARLHGALPRAVALGVVAVPKQRPRLVTSCGEIVFHRRAVAGLDLERVDTPLAGGYVTTVEQTLLDLARWSGWGLAPDTIREAIRSLADRADRHLTETLADRQRRRPALARALSLAGLVTARHPTGRPAADEPC